MAGCGEDASKNLEASLKNLKMDEKKDYDTSLAETYLKNYIPKIYPECFAEIKLDFELPLGASKESEILTKNRQCSLKIIDKLVENIELLAQLDNLIRGTNPEYIKKIDLPILINCFKRAVYGNFEHDNHNQILSNAYYIAPFVITIGEQDPVSKLGQIASLICNTTKCIYIKFCNDTSAICHLFVGLCMEAGISDDSIRLRPFKVDRTDTRSSHKNGAIAAVTSKSDMDSAIHTLLNSTQDCKYPWKLRRILVQENVYDKFKSAITHLTSEKISDDYLDLKNKAMDIQMYQEKLVLFDYFEETLLDWKKPIICIEAYRTTKELMSLLLKYSSDYLSLWCNEVSTTNEVTSKSNAQFIWINDIADFKGSVMLSNFIFDLPPSPIRRKNKHYLSNFDAKSLDDWSKKTYEERKNKLLKVFVNEEQQWFIKGWRPPSFYETSEGKCISGTVQPTGIDYFCFLDLNLKTAVHQNHSTNACIGSLLIGNGVLTDCRYVGTDSYALKDLCNLRVPVATLDGLDVPFTQTYKWKIIVSYFGESFAN